MRQDTDSGRGTSRVIVEKFAGDGYQRATAMVRGLARELIPEPLLYDSIAAFGRAQAEGGTDLERNPLAVLGAMAVEGTWNAHTVAWDHLEDVLAVEEVTPDGVMIARPRYFAELSGDRLRRLADDTERYILLRVLSQIPRIELGQGNIFLNNGTEFLWRRATGVGAQDQLFDTSHSRIGVGSSTAAEDRTHTDLQGASKTYQLVEATFPTITAGDASGGAKATFKAIFASGSANHDHKEWVVDNKGSGTPGVKVMNRKQQDFGTKASGSTWTYTNDLQIS